ncbi:MAG: hypothetical protein HEQ32_00945 [Vampirovibrio sp.]
MSKKPLWVFTGNRADYGLLHPLLLGLSDDPTWEITLWLGGEHLHNATSFLEACQIKTIKHRLLLPLEAGLSLPSQSVSAQMSQHQTAMTHAFQDAATCPQGLILLGDRFEAMGVALATFTARVPLLQLAGGDLTLGGSWDDRLRFAISSLATAVVCFSQKSEARLLLQGVLPPSHIRRTSSLAVDNARRIPLQSRRSFCEQWGLVEAQPFALFTQHPVVGQDNAENLHASLEALARFKDLQIVVTAPNQDVDAPSMQAVLHAFLQRYPHLKGVPHLGAEGYVQALRHSVGVLGNSSSGLYETALFQVPCLNIGSRQAGREHAANVIHCDYGVEAVSKGMQQLLYDTAFLASLKSLDSPFGSTPATPEILSFLKDIF